MPIYGQKYDIKKQTTIYSIIIIYSKSIYYEKASTFNDDTLAHLRRRGESG